MILYSIIRMQFIPMHPTEVKFLISYTCIFFKYSGDSTRINDLNLLSKSFITIRELLPLKKEKKIVEASTLALIAIASDRF